MANDTNTPYFQYVYNRSDQVFFWFTEQGADIPSWVPITTDYEQAGQIASWLNSVTNSETPAPLNLNFPGGATLSFSITGTAVTISETGFLDSSMSATFNLPNYSWMLLAVLYSIQAMVQNLGNIEQDAASHPLVKKMQAAAKSC
jgi:hypothetical protein